jgi:hypothetical protein
MKFVIVQFSPDSCQFALRRFKYSWPNVDRKQCLSVSSKKVGLETKSEKTKLARVGCPRRLFRHILMYPPLSGGRLLRCNLMLYHAAMTRNPLNVD